MEPVNEVDLSYIENQLDTIILSLEQHSIFLGELHYLFVWFVGGVTGVFILVLLYSIITKFAR